MLSSEQIRKQHVHNSEHLERLGQSLYLMTKTSCLVLDDLGGYCADLRELTLGQFEADARLLLGGLGSGTQRRVRFDFPAASADISFVERSGSTHLIVHNLCKNAVESIDEKFGASEGGELIVSAAVDGERLTLSVADNGVGMSAEQLVAVRNGDVESSKPGGHGLGMNFVHRECKENGYQLSVQARQGLGARFDLHIPLVQPA